MRQRLDFCKVILNSIRRECSGRRSRCDSSGASGRPDLCHLSHESAFACCGGKAKMQRIQDEKNGKVAVRAVESWSYVHISGLKGALLPTNWALWGAEKTIFGASDGLPGEVGEDIFHYA